MAGILESMILGYHDLIHERSDPRVKEFLLMGSPFPIILITIGYHYFVSNLGPKLMQSRSPIDVYYPMLVYNILQIGINGFFVFMIFKLKWLREGFSLACDPVDYNSNDPVDILLLWCGWTYFADKILDLLDTIFMVWRKKNNQVTFLHRYHHIAMVFCGWIGVKYVCGGHSFFFGTVNSLVHTIMYSYYTLVLVNPELSKNVWWKKHITQLQLIQFVALIVYYSIVLFNEDCNYPKFICWAFVPQNVFMLFLFLDFYRKAYKTTNAKSH